MADIVLKDRDGNDVSYEGTNALVVYDTNGNPAMFTFGDGTTSWDDIKDRPFYEEVYEDSYDFAVTPTVYFDALGNRFYKISDIALSYGQLLQTSFTLVSGETSESVIPTAEQFLFNSAEITGFISGDVGIGVAYTTGEIATDYGTLNVPETGTYIGFPEAYVPSEGTIVSFHYENVETLDPKYLPELDTLPEVTTDDDGKHLEVENGLWVVKTPTEVKELPEVTENDNGKVLGVVGGAWVVTEDEIGSVLPTVTADDNGKHLVVNNGEWTAQEVTETKELPNVTTEDNGKLLQVVDGTWAAVTIINGNEVAY